MRWKILMRAAVEWGYVPAIAKQMRIALKRTNPGARLGGGSTTEIDAKAPLGSRRCKYPALWSQLQHDWCNPRSRTACCERRVCCRYAEHLNPPDTSSTRAQRDCSYQTLGF